MISVIMPTYNEKEGIGLSVEKITEFMKKQPQDFEIVVVDDNSPDGTAAVVTELKMKYPNVKLLKRAGKLGIGSAYFDGFSLAVGEYLIGIDADLSPSLDAIPHMVEKLATGSGMVIGSRYLPQSRIYNMTGFKSGGSRLFNLFARQALGLKLADITHSNRAFSRDCFQVIAPHIKAKDHPAFFIECSFWADKLGYNPTEVPIVFTERTVGNSKLDLKKGLRGALRTIACLRKLK